MREREEARDALFTYSRPWREVSLLTLGAFDVFSQGSFGAVMTTERERERENHKVFLSPSASIATGSNSQIYFFTNFCFSVKPYQAARARNQL